MLGIYTGSGNQIRIANCLTRGTVLTMGVGRNMAEAADQVTADILARAVAPDVSSKPPLAPRPTPIPDPGSAGDA